MGQAHRILKSCGFLFRTLHVLDASWAWTLVFPKASITVDAQSHPAVVDEGWRHIHVCGPQTCVLLNALCSWWRRLCWGAESPV